jgi:hypothetical protein
MVKEGIRRLEAEVVRLGTRTTYWSREDIVSCTGGDWNGFNGEGRLYDWSVSSDYLVVVRDEEPPSGRMYVLAHELGHVVHWTWSLRKGREGFCLENELLATADPRTIYWVEVCAVRWSAREMCRLGIPITPRAARRWWMGSLRRYAQRLFGDETLVPADMPSPLSLEAELGIVEGSEEDDDIFPGWFPDAV